jgi:hypothetical protein
MCNFWLVIYFFPSQIIYNLLAICHVFALYVFSIHYGTKIHHVGFVAFTKKLLLSAQREFLWE